MHVHPCSIHFPSRKELGEFFRSLVLSFVSLPMVAHVLSADSLHLTAGLRALFRAVRAPSLVSDAKDRASAGGSVGPS